MMISLKLNNLLFYSIAKAFLIFLLADVNMYVSNCLDTFNEYIVDNLKRNRKKIPLLNQNLELFFQ